VKIDPHLLSVRVKNDFQDYVATGDRTLIDAYSNDELEAAHFFIGNTDWNEGYRLALIHELVERDFVRTGQKSVGEVVSERVSDFEVGRTLLHILETLTITNLYLSQMSDQEFGPEDVEL